MKNQKMTREEMIEQKEKIIFAKFQVKETKFLSMKLGFVELMELKECGVKSIIGRLKSGLLTHLKLNGEVVSFSDLKFKGLEEFDTLPQKMSKKELIGDRELEL